MPAPGKRRGIKPTTWLALVFVVLVVGALVLSTIKSQPYRCRVCITFNGRTDCRNGAAQSRLESTANRSVTACARIAAGITDSNHARNATGLGGMVP